jgi:integrase/recombinase XerD
MNNSRKNNPINKVATISYLTYQHIDAIIVVATNRRDRLMMWLLSRIGCRVSELLAIAIDDIDLASGYIIIKHLKWRILRSCPVCGVRLGRKHKFCPGCGTEINEATKEKLERHYRRILPIDKTTSAMIREYIECGGPVNHNGRLLLFGINRFRVRQIITECALRANIPKILNPDTGKIHEAGPHAFRVAFTIRWIQADDSPESLKALQQHLGHQNFTTTIGYRKMDFDERRKFYDKIGWETSK